MFGNEKRTEIQVGWKCSVLRNGRKFRIALSHANRVTFRQTNCQLRLRKSGKPSFLSLRKQWILPALRAPVNRSLRERAILNFLCIEIRND